LSFGVKPSKFNSTRGAAFSLKKMCRVLSPENCEAMTDASYGANTHSGFLAKFIKREIVRSGQNGNLKRVSLRKKPTLNPIFNQIMGLISSS